MSGDTIFLALFDEGWRVTAAGCERASTDPQEPYTRSLVAAIPHLSDALDGRSARTDALRGP